MSSKNPQPRLLTDINPQHTLEGSVDMPTWINFDGHMIQIALAFRDLPKVRKLCVYLPEDDQEQAMVKGGEQTKELGLQFPQTEGGGSPLERGIII